MNPIKPGLGLERGITNLFHPCTGVERDIMNPYYEPIETGLRGGEGVTKYMMKGKKYPDVGVESGIMNPYNQGCT